MRVRDCPDVVAFPLEHLALVGLAMLWITAGDDHGIVLTTDKALDPELVMQSEFVRLLSRLEGVEVDTGDVENYVAHWFNASAVKTVMITSATPMHVAQKNTLPISFHMAASPANASTW